MIIKKKSLLVALVSSVLISMVLVTTIVAYLLYIEMRDRNFRSSYDAAMKKASARAYAKQIEFFRLKAVTGEEGPLKGRLLVEGVLINNGNRAISDMLVRIKFRDTDGAVIYEVVFHPQEPTLGISILAHVPIPSLSEPQRVPIDPGNRLIFKRVLTDCPREIAMAIREGGVRRAGTGRAWSGTLEPEILSMEF